MNKKQNDSFTKYTDRYILAYATIIFIVLGIVLLFFNWRFTVSTLLGYAVGAIVFVKNNLVITKLLNFDMLRPKFWMVLSNFISMVLYCGVTLVFIFIYPFHLVGICGLFIIPLTTIICGIIYR